jgi:hypothetical protein
MRDPASNIVTVFQPFRWLQTSTDTGWRASDDDSSSWQSAALREE